MSEKGKNILVGSRKSELALIQTRYVISQLKEKYPNKEFEIITMNTLGDRVLDRPLPKIGEKSLFTKELEVALASGCVDFVVHSLKDLPTCLPEGMAIGAVLEREDPRDALVVRCDLEARSLSDLPAKSVIGTSSLRRCAQLVRNYPNLVVEDIRGNLNTRLRKLDELKKYDAIVLAKAGLTRMGWNNRISQVLKTDELLYAVGQGALAVECRADDDEILSMLASVHHSRTVLSIVAERSFLKTLGGGCSAPVAVTSSYEIESDKVNLKLTGSVWSLDGKTLITDTHTRIVNVDNTFIDQLEKNDCRCSNGTCQNVKTVSDASERTETDNLIRKCPFASEQSTKKLKTGSGETCPFSKDVSDDKCPVTMPVGIDFMGKCPYLDSDQTTSKCPVNATVLSENGSGDKPALKCPFINNDSTLKTDGLVEINSCLLKSSEPGQKVDDKLFCGVVKCKSISVETMQEAERLGISLAESLINKGALDVMREAQATIRSGISK